MTGEESGRRVAQEVDESELVFVAYTADLDRDKLEEYADEAHPDAEHVQISDRIKTDDLLFRGERPGYICPECGREALSFRSSSGGARIYSHGIDDKCEWQDPEWEPSEHHPDHPSNQTPWWRRALMQAIGFAIPLVVILGVYAMLPETTVSMGGETVPFPPDLWPAAVSVVLFAVLFLLILRYAPGISGSRRGL